MDSWEALSQMSLGVKGPVSVEFAARGIQNIREAGRSLHALPYGRTVNRAELVEA